MFASRLTVLLAALGLAACTLGPRPLPDDLIARCETYLHALDEAAATHEVGDAGAWRLPGFPHLRSTRFLAAFRDQSLNAEQTRAWLMRLHAVDAQARAVELANLPMEARDVSRLQSPFAAGHTDAIARCGVALIERDLSDPERLASIRIRSNVPIHYSNWQRVVGLYPVSQLFVRRGINALHKELVAEFALPLDQLPVRGQLQRYKPATAPDLPTSRVAEILREARRTPLAIPEPEPAQLVDLLGHFAPIWEVEQVSDDDRIGQIRYDNDRQSHYVDLTMPVTYQWASHTLFNGQPLLQLNYLVWVPARTAVSATDIYAGKFDGLIWRVTLLPDGSPLAYDSVHPCGCYYLLFTGAKATPRATSNVAEPVLAAQNLPMLEPAQRMVIRVRAGDHYIQRVYPDSDARGIVYQSADYQSLLSITDASGQAHRLFDERGLLPASARPERHLFWPFGIASAGAMRRAGTHAIAFVGVRHFDDANLLEELVELWASP